MTFDSPVVFSLQGSVFRVVVFIARFSEYYLFPFRDQSPYLLHVFSKFTASHIVLSRICVDVVESDVSVKVCRSVCDPAFRAEFRCRIAVVEHCIRACKTYLVGKTFVFLHL